MLHFIHNIGDYFSANYFDEDFAGNVTKKSGYSSEDLKELGQRIARLKPDYFKLKQKFIDNHLRTKDKINLSHAFHTLLLNALGYDAAHTQYHDLFAINDNSVLPVRHILYRGAEVHLMVLEMHALIKTKDQENPDGLFEQSYNVANEEEAGSGAQKYHRAQWADIFTVPGGMSISPMIINEAINQLFLLPTHRRPKYILLCGGNQYFLLEAEKWFRGSYLQLDLEALWDDAALAREYYAVFYLLLGKNLLAPTADMVLMEQLDEDAHKAAYEVTKDLKEGVIHAVENLANEAVQYLVGEGTRYEDINADSLKNDCLNMVYRLLFLFYAEAREDLDILPGNDEVYERGYSLEMLRDLELVPLVTESSRNGYFFHQSLFGLFSLLNRGYREEDGQNRSFKIRHLDSPLFRPEELTYLNRVKIRNRVWQDVICELSLSKKQRGKNRGRISYANLGINQLGSVYESLLAFRGFLAETDYIEVHRKKKQGETSEKVVHADGSFLVPRHRLDDFDPGEVFYTEKEEAQDELRVIPQGSFIYRLSGRDRQKSASYYTPEVLTQTTVKYTLKPILERLDKGDLKPTDLLKLKILEPAMGAAAFHNEVINQLAQAYLTYRQEELQKKVNPNHYAEELQKIKAYIALNNVYGVDINPTAVELGKLSLWLNVIHKDMQTPFFGYRLGVGNAVVGSWLKVFKHKDFAFVPKGSSGGFEKRDWWNKAPRHLKFGKKGLLRKEDEIYHFLLPDVGMVSSAGIKLLKEAHPEEARRVSEWRKTFCEPLRAGEYARLQGIARAIDALLLEHYEIQKNIALVTEANSAFFGNEKPVLDISFGDYSYQQKEQFACERLKPNAPYYKLKLIMDYWCSLWFWDVRHAADLPSRQQWYEDLEQILNTDLKALPADENGSNSEDAARDYRKEKKELEKELAEALQQSSASLFTNERAKLVQELAAKYLFFHYELEFIEVFRENNGFDIAVGNPPWLKVQFEEKGLMSEVFPELEIRKVSAPGVKKLQAAFLEVEAQREVYFAENIENEASATFLNAYQNYPLLAGQQTNLYKCVLENGLHWINEEGYLGLIHPEGIYDDPNGDALRKEIYKRLKYHFQFRNERSLFSEVGHTREFSINIYGKQKPKIDFVSISNLFHPSTIEGSLIHNGQGICAGIKVKCDETGRNSWNVESHRDRIIKINEKSLFVISKVFDNGLNHMSTKLPYIHTFTIINVLTKLSEFPTSLSNVNFKTSEGWHEVSDVGKYIEEKIINVNYENYEYIITGKHIYLSNPIYKSPSLISKKFSIVEHSKTNDNFIPNSLFSISTDLLEFKEAKGKAFSKYLWIDSFKVCFRKMLDKGMERTLIPAIIPQKSSHTNGVISVVFKEASDLLEFAGLCSSLTCDFYIKSLGKSNLYDDTLKEIPLGIDSKYKSSLFVRTLQLNCLNKYYAPLWEESFDFWFTQDSWSLPNDNRLKPFAGLMPEWNWHTPLRNYFERRMALLEIDVITAMALGLSLEELVLMYNIQFPVLQQNEDDTWYDALGNIVFTCSKGLTGVGLDRAEWNTIRELPAGKTYTHTITKSELYHGQQVVYQAPFTKCDRVEDYKRAWTHFEARFGEREEA